MTRKALALLALLALLAVAVAVVGVAGLLHSATAEATSHRTVRSFSAPWVLPGGALEVTIAAAGYGGFGQIVETLPPGFSYKGSDLPEAAVAIEGQTVAFTLLGDRRFTYAVAAPGAEGTYSFSGVILDSNKVEQTVVGDSSIRTCPEPTPTPTPAPTATPTPTPTNPRRRPRPRPRLRPRPRRRPHPRPRLRLHPRRSPRRPRNPRPHQRPHRRRPQRPHRLPCPLLRRRNRRRGGRYG